MTMPVSEMMRLVKIQLEPVAGEESAQQAKLLIAAVIGAEPAALAIHAWTQMTQEQIALVGELLERRLLAEPLQYILGEWSFMGLPFYTDERALIPRQDTELLAETALRLIRERGYGSCLDLCTGGGCVGVSVSKLSGVRVTASDLSAEALDLARENAQLNQVEISFIESDLFDRIAGRFDLIVSNPPYLSRADMDSLQKEVTFEPALALFGGEDGLDIYRRIAKAYQHHLNPGGVMLLEIGSTQAEAVSLLFSEKTNVFKDLNGNPRVLAVEP